MIKRNIVLITAILSFFMPGLCSAQKVEIYPKIANFIFFIDQSGSMQKKYKALKKSKISVAKSVLLAMNKEIPELNYKGAIELFAPNEQVLAPTLYKTDTFQKALEKISTTFPIYKRYTPMAPGLKSLDKILENLTGDTAVILLTDGEANRGGDPLAEARVLEKKYGSGLCFHVISLANKPAARKLLQAIVGLNNCRYVSGADMQNPDLLKIFVRNVFYGIKVKRKIKQEEQIRFRNVNFDFDKFDLTAKSRTILDSMVKVLKNHPKIKVVIKGFTDSTGGELYNKKLGKKRAMSVFNYLKTHGIEAFRMKTVTFGESHPEVENNTAEGRAINRRVEFRVEK